MELVSLRASIGAADTTIVTVAGSQFVGFSISHNWYMIVYVPAGVCGSTLTVPVTGSSSTPGFVEGVVIVITTSDGTTGTPFKVSFVKTFTTSVSPSYPLTGVGLSLFATIGAAATFTVTCAVSQFVEFNTSQIV